MIGLRSRRIFSIAVTSIALLAAWQGDRWFDDHLQRPDFYSGYMLLAATLLLFLLAVRKKLIVLRLGPVSGWLQMHQYAGIFALGVFVLHTGWPIQGRMETVLAACFLFISFSGLVTWYLNRTVPKRMRVAGPAHILEDSPNLRNRLAQQAYAVALTAAARAESASLAEHYTSRLVAFFQQPRSLAYVLIPNGRMRRLHLDSLERLDRYLGPDGRKARIEMSQLVQAKDDLDFQDAMQKRLRLWKSLHTSMLWFFGFLVAVHVILAHRFHGA